MAATQQKIHPTLRNTPRSRMDHKSSCHSPLLHKKDSTRQQVMHQMRTCMWSKCGQDQGTYKTANATERFIQRWAMLHNQGWITNQVAIPQCCTRRTQQGNRWCTKCARACGPSVVNIEELQWQTRQEFTWAASRLCWTRPTSEAVWTTRQWQWHISMSEITKLTVWSIW